MKVTGSLQIRSGTYYMMVRVPDINGHQKQKLKTTSIKVEGKNQRETRHNKIEADRMLAAWIEELSQGGLVCEKLFISCAVEWLERKKRHVRLDTYEAYNSYYNNHIKPYFEPLNLRIDEVTPRHIQKYIDQKEKDGQSPNSIDKHMVVINGIFKEAVALQEIKTNPCSNATISRSEEEFHGSAYEASDAKRLLNAIRGDAIEPAVYLGLYLGLRRSEVVGLRWQDIDFKKNVVHIRNTVVRFKTVSEVEKTKSRASKRDLYLPNGLKQYLLYWRYRIDLNKKVFGKKHVGSDHVCQWPDGRPYMPDYVSMRFRKILKANNLPIIRFHDLRHTAGSLLINDGQSIKQVQEFLGHEKASTTLDVYTHLSFDGKKDTGEKLDELLADAK